jgi:hypothetical protein
MNEIVKKLVQTEQEMASEKGRFLLFALFLREDAPDLWDVVVATPGVTKNKSDSLQYMSNKLRAVLNTNEFIKLSRIVIIEPENPALAALQQAISIEHGTTEIKDGNFFGPHIKRAYLITSRRDADPAPNNSMQRSR